MSEPPVIPQRRRDDPERAAQASQIASIVERLLASSTVQTTTQFASVTKLLEQRVDANKEQSEARFAGLTELSEERWSVLRAQITHLEQSLSTSFQRADHEQHTLIIQRIEALEDQRGLRVKRMSTDSTRNAAISSARPRRPGAPTSPPASWRGFPSLAW